MLCLGAAGGTIPGYSYSMTHKIMAVIWEGGSSRGYYTWLLLLHDTQDHGYDLGGRNTEGECLYEYMLNHKKVNHSFILETAFLKEEDHREAIAHTFIPTDMLHKCAFPYS